MPDHTEHDIAMMADWSELRESKGLSLDDIAAKTNISMQKLKAIEAHEFDLLGEETFALGYLRSYAKIVGENPEVFVQVYRDANSPLGQTQRGLTLKDSGQEGVPWWAKVSLLKLSIGIIVLWLLFIFLVPSDEEETPQAPLAVAKTQSTPIATPLPRTTPTPYVSTPTPQVAVIPSPIPTAIAEQPSEAVSESLRENVESIGVGDDILVFGFADDCWLEVTDSEGRVLIAELKRKGDNQRLLGQGPFDVMLGNARAVTLTLNGQAVPTTPPPGRDTLRFQVPALREE